MEKKVIELFAGVGGFRVGLNDVHAIDVNGKAIEIRDWKFVWANQWEPSTKTQHAYDCYTKRFGNGSTNPDSNRNISEIDETKIPNHTLLVGGFPCQDYSVARSLSGEKGIEGKKGVLFWDIKRIIEAKNTPFILLENVDRLLKSPAKQRGRDFGIMLRTLSDLHYNVEWRIINAAEYGCAQRRRRLFIFAWKRDLKYNLTVTGHNIEELIFNEGLFARTFPIYETPKNNIGLKEIDLNEFSDTFEMTSDFRTTFKNTGIMIDGIAYTLDSIPVAVNAITLGQIRENRNGLEEYFLNENQDEKFRYLRGSKKVLRTKEDGVEYFYSEGSMSYPDSLDLPGRTMLTSEASVNRSTHIIEDYETGNLRFITPVEAERLQSFPDNWTDTGMPEKRRYFMMGNALVTGIVNMIEPNLSEIIENE